MTSKITRIHKEVRPSKKPRLVEIDDGQEICQKMEHRAWITLKSTCPYCKQEIAVNGSMRQLPGHVGGQVYTIVAEHVCQ